MEKLKNTHKMFFCYWDDADTWNLVSYCISIAKWIVTFSVRFFDYIILILPLLALILPLAIFLLFGNVSEPWIFYIGVFQP